MAGTVVGQPPRKRLRIDDDPFGAVGDYAGSFLIKSAVEFSGGYDTNPGRTRRRARHRRSMWSRRNSSRSPTGSVTRWSPTSRAPSPATPTLFTPIADGTPLSAPIEYRSSGFHRPCRRPSRRHPRHPAARAGAIARRDRQSRQPECAGRPVQISDLCDGRRHAWRRSELQPPAALRRRRGRPHHLSVVEADRRHLDQQRRPQLQPIWRPRPRQLRPDAGPETVRRNRRQHPLARPPGRS